MKYLFITIKVQNGEYIHIERVLHTTKAKNIDFAAERYTSKLFGFGEREDDFWWFFNEITAKCLYVKELTKSDYDFLEDLF